MSLSIYLHVLIHRVEDHWCVGTETRCAFGFQAHKGTSGAVGGVECETGGSWQRTNHKNFQASRREFTTNGDIWYDKGHPPKVPSGHRRAVI